jgi:hypothetical protein
MRRIAVLLAAVSLLAACGASADEAAPPPSAAELFLARAEAAAAPPPELAGAIRAADGSASFAVHEGRLLRFDPGTRRTRTYDLPGDWALGGVSATGRWVGLTRPGTTVLVVDTERGEIAHELTLEGRFAVETISAEGDFLFLEQSFVDGGYAVRGYDLVAGRLLPGSLAAKGETVVMQGLAAQRVASPDGRWLLTLYVNTATNTAFVHALDLIERAPVCIALPPCERCGRKGLAQWVLALAPDRRTLYAANPAAGRVAEIDLAASRVVAGSSFAPARGDAPFAELDRAGSRLLFTNGEDVWSYDTARARVAEEL